MSVYHDPQNIVMVAKVNAMTLAKPSFFIAFSAVLLIGTVVVGDVPTPAWWVGSFLSGLIVASVQYYWIYLTRAVWVINLELEAVHTEETSGMTFGDYRLTRPTPPVSTGGRVQRIREGAGG